LPQLEELNVRMNGVGPGGAAALAEARLHVLGIEDNPLGDAGVCALVDSGLLGRTSRAVLIDVGLGVAGAARLAACRREVRGVLRLGLNALGDAGVAALLDGPAVDGLSELGLACNDVGDRGAELLADSPAVRGLDVLELVGNSLTARGRAALGAALRAGVLRIEGDTP